MLSPCLHHWTVTLVVSHLITCVAPDVRQVPRSLPTFATTSASPVSSTSTTPPSYLRLLLHGVLRWLQCHHPLLAWLRHWLRQHPILLLLPVSRLGIRLLLHEGLLLPVLLLLHIRLQLTEWLLLCVWLLLQKWLLLHICLRLHVLLLLQLWLLLPVWLHR